MDKTKSNTNELRHCELEIRAVTQDAIDFANYIIDSKCYKFKRAKYVISQVFVGIILFLFAIAGAVMIYDITGSELARWIFSGFAGVLVVKIINMLRCPYPKISEDDVVEAVINTTSPIYGEEEKNMFFNFGEKGFSTDAHFGLGTLIYEYGAFNKVIECELGIIAILDEIFIYCIPARYFDDESACFAVEKFRKECGKKFITTGKMKITQTTTERNEHK